MASQTSPENVVGRDVLIERIWRRLKKKSVRLTAESRIGKTTVMKKMEAEPREGYKVLFFDLEGIDTPDRFTEALLGRVKPLLSKKDSARRWMSEFMASIGGTEIGGVVKLPDKSRLGWKATLEKAFEGICLHQPDRVLLMLFDEVPYMLQKIEAAMGDDGPSRALTLLDILRSVRQRHKNLRMIYSGSVGLHHVLMDLRQDRLASEPINDMPLIEIHSLAHEDALTLAAQLLREESIPLKEATASKILDRLVKLTDCIPFYLEAVVSQLAELERDLTIDDVERTVRHQLTTDLDPWEMEHFRDRLKIYYEGSITDTMGKDLGRADIARSLLDHFSLIDQPQAIDEVWEYVTSQFAIADRQLIVQMLKSLGEDHYLISDDQKRYSFRFPLIKGWWKTAQGLS